MPTSSPFKNRGCPLQPLAASLDTRACVDTKPDPPPAETTVSLSETLTNQSHNSVQERKLYEKCHDGHYHNKIGVSVSVHSTCTRLKTENLTVLARGSRGLPACDFAPRDGRRLAWASKRASMTFTSKNEHESFNAGHVCKVGHGEPHRARSWQQGPARLRLCSLRR